MSDETPADEDRLDKLEERVKELEKKQAAAEKKAGLPSGTLPDDHPVAQAARRGFKGE